MKWITILGLVVQGVGWIALLKRFNNARQMEQLRHALESYLVLFRGIDRSLKELLVALVHSDDGDTA